MQYQFTFELVTPGPEFRGHGNNNNESPIKFVGLVDTDNYKPCGKNNLALVYRDSMCGMIVAALASAIQGAKESGFKVTLAGFSDDREHAAADNSATYRTPAIPKIIAPNDISIYDRLCRVRGEAWFNISILTPCGDWNHNCFNSSNPVKVSWEPFVKRFLRVL